MDPFSQMTGLLSVSAAAIFFAFTPFALLGLAIPYAVLRLRDSRDLQHDPELGLKAVLYFSFSLAVFIGLVGLTVLAVDMLVDKERNQPVIPPAQAAPVPGFGPGGVPGRPMFQPPRRVEWLTPVRRNSLALVTAGFLLSAFHWLILVGFTNTRRWPAARRVFVGWRFAVHAVVLLATLTALVWVLFQKDWDLDALKTITGVLAVWGPSWMIHLALLHLYGKEKGPRRAIPPAEVVDVVEAD